MTRSSYFLLFIFLILWGLWGCPTKKLIPDPMPPQPQVDFLKNEPVQWAYDWQDVVHILKGMAPLVGPAPWFFRMLA